MNEPLFETITRPNGVAADYQGPIPTAHDPLSDRQVASFAEWMDLQLLTLEERFRSLMTPNSYWRSLGKR